MEKRIHLKLILILFFGILLKSQTQAHASTPREDVCFFAYMDGSQMGTSSTAVGVATFMLNSTKDSISVNTSIISANATSVSIYAVSGSNAGEMILDLTSNLNENRVSTSIAGNEFSEIRTALLKNELFIQVGTADFPEGELGGFIQLTSNYNLVANLSPDETIPINNSNAFGLGSFDLSFSGDRINFKIICQDIEGDITSVKLHQGFVGTNGPEIEDLTVFLDGNVIIGSILTTPELTANAFNEGLYLNVSTTEFPDGQLRSQLKIDNGLSFEVFADGDQAVPEVNTDAKGLGVFRISPTLDTLYYDIVGTDFNSSINYLHFHNGSEGEQYGALSLDFSSTTNGSHSKGFLSGSQISEDRINRLLLSDQALIFHSGNVPNGEIRGQAKKFALETYTVHLEGEQVVPAVSTSGYGSGMVSVDRSEDRAYYYYVAGNLSSTVTSTQLFTADPGDTGTMIQDISNNAFLINQAGTDVLGFGQWSDFDIDPFTDMTASLMSEDDVYLRINTIDFPEGELRGQLLGGTIFYNSGVSSSQDIEKDIYLNVFPNPASSLVNVNYHQDNSEAQLIEIIDMSGRIVLSVNSTGNTQLDLSGLQAGSYLIRLRNENRIATRLIFKN